VILDPISSFVHGNDDLEVRAMLMRLTDFLKMQQITSFFTSLNSDASRLEKTEVAMSSLIDTWLSVRAIEINGERNRELSVLKSRGMAHSNQTREFLLTDHGVEVRDVYVGPEGLLTGSARLTQEAEDKAELLIRSQDVELRRTELERKRTTLEAQIAMLRAEFAEQEAASLKIIGQETAEKAKLAQGRVDMGVSRKVDAKPDKTE